MEKACAADSRVYSLMRAARSSGGARAPLRRVRLDFKHAAILLTGQETCFGIIARQAIRFKMNKFST